MLDDALMWKLVVALIVTKAMVSIGVCFSIKKIMNFNS
jgi:hypothetical protein